MQKNDAKRQKNGTKKVKNGTKTGKNPLFSVQKLPKKLQKNQKSP